MVQETLVFIMILTIQSPLYPHPAQRPCLILCYRVQVHTEASICMPRVFSILGADIKLRVADSRMSMVGLEAQNTDDLDHQYSLHTNTPPRNLSRNSAFLNFAFQDVSWGLMPVMKRSEQTRKLFSKWSSYPNMGGVPDLPGRRQGKDGCASARYRFVMLSLCASVLCDVVCAVF